MAKNRNAASQKQAKLKNNKAGFLVCHHAKCDNEYYLAKMSDGTSIRTCRAHFENPPQTLKQKRTADFTAKLAMLGIGG